MDTELYYVVVKGTNTTWDKYGKGNTAPRIFDTEKVAQEEIDIMVRGMKDRTGKKSVYQERYVPIKIAEYNRKYMDKADDSEAE